LLFVHIECELLLHEQKGAKKKKGFSLTPEKKKLLKVRPLILLLRCWFWHSATVRKRWWVPTSHWVKHRRYRVPLAVL